MTWTTTFLKHVAILTLDAGNQRKNHREKTGKAPVCGTVAGRAWLDERPSCMLLCAGWVYLFMVVYVRFYPWLWSCCARCVLCQMNQKDEKYYLVWCNVRSRRTQTHANTTPHLGGRLSHANWGLLAGLEKRNCTNGS